MSSQNANGNGVGTWTKGFYDQWYAQEFPMGMNVVTYKQGPVIILHKKLIFNA